jgi:hypothetical protein
MDRYAMATNQLSNPRIFSERYLDNINTNLAFTCKVDNRARTIRYVVNSQDTNDLAAVYKSLKTIPNRVSICQITNSVIVVVKMTENNY